MIPSLPLQNTVGEFRPAVLHHILPAIQRRHTGFVPVLQITVIIAADLVREDRQAAPGPGDHVSASHSFQRVKQTPPDLFQIGSMIRFLSVVLPEC